MTTPSPVPRVIAVPLKTRFLRSAKAKSPSNASVVLLTGTDSPVNADSSACSLEASNKRRSAATKSPPSNTTISPGTNSSAAISCTLPSLRTLVLVLLNCCKDSIERTALISVKKPITVLSKIAIIIATPSIHS